MIVTSLKTMNEIRDGNLFSLPNAINFDAWKIAWSGRGEGTSDTYLKPYFLNSLKNYNTCFTYFYIFRSY